MNRRGFLTMCAAMAACEAAAAPPPRDPFGELADKMHQAWDRFYRKLKGCSATATNTAECRPALGGIDRTLFAQARKAAGKVFDFES